MDSSNKTVGIVEKDLKVLSNNKDIKNMFKAVLNMGISAPYVDKNKGERGLIDKEIENEAELFKQLRKTLPMFGYSVKEE